jgi:Tfp pilus assembly PilM family ATPase
MVFNYVCNCLKRRSISIGIDIGNKYANLIKLRKNSNNYTVIDYKTYINDNPFEALKHIGNNRVVIALKYQSILTKIITLDSSLTNCEIKKYLYNNIEKYLGFSSKQICMDFEIIKKNLTKMDVKLVTAKKNCVDSILALSTKANVKLKALDVEHFALARAVSSLFNLSNNNVVAAINCKDNYLLFCFMQNTQIIYANEVYVFDNNITQPIINELQSFFANNNLLITHLILSGNDDINKIDAIAIENAIKSKITISMANPLKHCIPNGFQFAAEGYTSGEEVSRSLMLCYGLALWGHNSKL